MTMRRLRTALACLGLFLLMAVPVRADDGRAVSNVTASSTNASLVAGVAGKQIRVTSVILSCGATATAVTFRSKPSGTGTDISATFTLGANGVLVLPHTDAGWFDTVAGESLTVTTGSGATVGMLVAYRLK